MSRTTSHLWPHWGISEDECAALPDWFVIRSHYAGPPGRRTAEPRVFVKEGVDPRDAELALKVRRAGGNPDARYESGIGAAQWNYKRPRKAADRDAMVLALTSATYAREEIAA